MNTTALEATARELVAPAKGILAADESGPTIEKRFNSVGVPNTAELRRAYREMLFTTPGLARYISGVILYDETLRQKSVGGSSLVDVLAQQGIIPGIKVDRGAKPLAGFPREKVTEGLDGLRERLAEYAALGARFTKWRAVVTMGAGLPTSGCIQANAHALARFAALSQEAGLVPIVEPEVLMDGDHSLDRHGEVTATALRSLFAELHGQRVQLEGLLLKVNMVLSGTLCAQQASIAEAAVATRRCMQRATPAATPGIVFLSGGQADIRATEHLDAVNRLGQAPWPLSFSFGRALQAPALKIWAGKPENATAAQQALLHRARCNSAARAGKYTRELEDTAP
ncbi:MAG: hypothetical protein RIQ93_3221 [Verrucomicrobiota bacterium]|jgi:fructose-bisphosphate aldolase class I